MDNALVDLLRSEAELYAGYILANHPNARIAVLYQNDDFGRDYLNGLKERRGAQADRMVVAIASYEASDSTVDSQVITRESSGANTLLIAAGPIVAGFGHDGHSQNAALRKRVFDCERPQGHAAVEAFIIP